MANPRNRRGRGSNVVALPPREPPSINGRTPPHDLDSEVAVLSACLIDPRRIRDILWLRPEQFYSEKHRLIWEATVWVYATGEPLDVLLVGARLKDTDRIAQVGGMAYLAEILNSAPSIHKDHVEKYARIISDKARVRQAIAAAQAFATEGYLDYGATDAYLARGAQELADISNRDGSRLRVRGVDEIFAPIPDVLPYLSQGLRLIAGRAAMIAGYSYTGKTLTAQALALAVAAGCTAWGTFKIDTPGIVGHLNWDQPWLDTRIRYHRLANGMGLDWTALRGRLEVVQYPRLQLDDEGGLATVRAFCRDKVLVIIDALIGAAGDVPESDPAIGRIVYDLNAISEETGCTILVIHHAGKTAKNVNGRQVEVEPLEQIRGSSSIAGACGAVFILQRGGKGKPVRVVQAKTPALTAKAIEPFALRFEDVDSNGKHGAGVRVAYVHLEELEAEKAAEEAARRPKVDKAAQAVEKERERAEAAAAAWIERRRTVLETVKANVGASANVIAKKSGVRRADVGPMLDELLAGSLVVVDGGGWRAI